jgi:dolichyl-phosphate beta-glucosyltransferase
VESRFDLTLIFPAYNEAATIVSTIEESLAYLAGVEGLKTEIIVAADGDDGTREKVRNWANGDGRIQVLGHERRLGKGRGVREAMAMARGEWIGYADADNKVPIEEFRKVRRCFEETGCDIVAGSRALKESVVERRQPLYRRVGSVGFHHFMHAATGLWEVSDSQCGFKFFRREAAQVIFAHQRVDGYMLDVEVLLLAKRFGFQVREVPIRWRDDGDSRLQLVRGNLRNVWDVLRIRWIVSRLSVAEGRGRTRAAARG